MLTVTGWPAAVAHPSRPSAPVTRSCVSSPADSLCLLTVDVVNWSRRHDLTTSPSAVPLLPPRHITANWQTHTSYLFDLMAISDILACDPFGSRDFWNRWLSYCIRSHLASWWNVCMVKVGMPVSKISIWRKKETQWKQHNESLFGAIPSRSRLLSSRGMTDYRIDRHALADIDTHRRWIWPHRHGKTGAGVWKYSFTVWILGEW